ncbi:MAG: DNA repair protein [Colwellia sp. Phe_37]|nr:MAG: DNA repair protein [Colwellia sp. Phe_37]|tara:strand:+ start:14104 stop:14772 length:669 start_codon:yes stop_codon:yes gene_type:complete
MITSNNLLQFKKYSIFACSLVLMLGCQSAYYSAMEKVGVHKRDIMLDRVESAQTAQQDAQQQFTSALAQLSQLINYDGGDLAAQYELINDQYEASESSAKEVASRIAAIESVADALFDEWNDEIQQYSSNNLKQQSQQKLKKTQRNYESLIKSMHRAKDRMAPVLSALKDNSLYLKHNLNAQAIGALQGEYKTIKRDVESLVAEMNKAIAQSQQFIDLLQPE